MTLMRWFEADPTMQFDRLQCEPDRGARRHVGTQARDLNLP